MLEFTSTHNQTKLLKGLAYWIADRAYLIERYGRDEPEIKTADNAIISLFDKCDELQIPFWVQNTVMAFAEDWRRYKTEYMEIYLRNHRNINLK